MRVTRWLVYVYCRAWAGRWLNNKYQAAKRRFMIKAWPYRCAHCEEVAYKNDRSVDHIIPQWLCIELEFFDLIYDKRNFQVMHKRCNSIKGGVVSLKSLILIGEYLELGHYIAETA